MKKENRKGSDEFFTPPYITDPLGPFDLDPCAGEVSIGAVNYRLPETDGLFMKWSGFVWLNPPFASKSQWVEKIKRHGNGILLLSARTDSDWFINLIGYTKSVYFLKRRVKFLNGETNSSIGTALFPFGSEAQYRLTRSSIGYMMTSPLIPAIIC